MIYAAVGTCGDILHDAVVFYVKRRIGKIKICTHHLWMCVQNANF